MEFLCRLEQALCVNERTRFKFFCPSKIQCRLKRGRKCNSDKLHFLKNAPDRPNAVERPCGKGPSASGPHMTQPAVIVIFRNIVAVVWLQAPHAFSAWGTC